MTKRIGATCLLVGVLNVTAAFAQAPLTPQQSRERSPNMPPTHETVPERIRPGDPDATGSIRRPRAPGEAPKMDKSGKQSG